MSAGYSGRNLADKLGIEAGMRIAILGAPRSYRSTLGALPDGVSVTATPRGPLPLIHFFTKQRAVLGKRFPALKRALAQIRLGPA